MTIYPDHSLTPGDVFAVTKDQVCTPGYSSSVRDVSVSLKEQVYSEYGVSYPQGTGMYEVDHFIPLELGGSNSIKNLWLEPANPRPGFHEKDQVENYLHKEVCSGSMTLSEAQNKIRSDWYAVYLSMGGTVSTGSTTSINGNPVANINTAPVNNAVQQPGGFTCDCSKTCTVISSCAEAQYQLTVCGCSARDGDKDGIACDGSPLNCQH